MGRDANSTTLGVGGKCSVAKRPYCCVEWWFSEVELRAPGAKRGRAQFHLRKPPRSTATQFETAAETVWLVPWWGLVRD